MHARDVLRILDECTARGTDAYGLAVEVALAVEVDTREALAVVTDELGMPSVSEAVRQGAHESIAAAVLSVVAGLAQRHANETTLMQAVVDAARDVVGVTGKVDAALAALDAFNAGAS